MHAFCIGSKQTALVTRSSIGATDYGTDRWLLLIRRIVFHQFQHRRVSQGTLLNDRLGLGFSSRKRTALGTASHHRSVPTM